MDKLHRHRRRNDGPLLYRQGRYREISEEKVEWSPDQECSIMRDFAAREQGEPLTVESIESLLDVL